MHSNQNSLRFLTTKEFSFGLGPMSQILKFYFSDCHFTVNYGEEYSDLTDVVAGVPQETNLVLTLSNNEYICGTSSKKVPTGSEKIRWFVNKDVTR